MKTTRRQLMKAATATAAGSVLGIPMHVLAQAARNGIVVIGSTQKPRHLNPAVQSGIATMSPGAQLFATPLTIDAKWKAQPYLAERWSVSDDARSITLHLRKDATFHDGKPITSEDVAFSVEVVKANHPFKSMLAPVNAVSTPDAHTAIIRLAEPHPVLELVMTTVFLPILPKHVYGDGQPLATHPRNAKDVVGSGPFKLVEFKPGEQQVFERFDAFFMKGAPKFDRLIIREFKDSSSALLAFESGGIDMLIGIDDARDAARVKKTPGAKMIDNAGFGIGPLIWLAFNTKDPKLADKRVRQAIAYAIDRNFLVKTLLGNYHKASTGPITSGSPLYSADVPKYDLDLKKAAELLDAAGVKAGAGGKRMTLTLDNIPGNQAMRTAAEYIKPALAKVGIEVVLRASPDFPTWARRVSSHQFEMTVDSVWNWGDPVIGVHRTYQTSNIRPGVIWSNTQQYSNPKVDELMAAAGKEQDRAKRKALYKEFQRIVVDDAPIAFLLEVNYGVGIRNATGFEASVWGMMEPLLDLKPSKSA
ncbi:MAG: ABC transporter substrate-binding protein [Lautropia sp.]